MTFQPFGKLDSAPSFLRPVEFRAVRSVDELKTAANLVYREYMSRGYLTAHPSELKLSLYNALTTTTTFVGVHHRLGVIATITLIVDSPLGLPMDEIYKTELDELRGEGHLLAEASMLSLDSRLFGRKVFTLFHPKKMFLTLRLFKVLFDYMRSGTPVSELVACFNPKHQSLYDLLHLEPLGRLKYYSSANGNPAIARHLNIAKMQPCASCSPIVQFFYGKPVSGKSFANRLVLSPENLEELFVRQVPVFASASRTEMDHVVRCYPSYDFSQILASVPASADAVSQPSGNG